MIQSQDLLRHASDLLAAAQASSHDPTTEAQARRAISAAYYALFHTLTADAASQLAPADPPSLRSRLRRVFEHRQAKAACDVLVRWNKAQAGTGLKPLLSSVLDADLLQVAETFSILQEERHSADYDLSTHVLLRDAVKLVQQSHDAHAAWATVRDTPDARVFLTLLLLGDRLYRRG